MSSSPEMPEPSYPEMSETLFKEHPTTAGKRRKKAILFLAIGILAAIALREAWDRGIITLVSENIWNLLCRVAADWKAFLQEAFRS